MRYVLPLITAMMILLSVHGASAAEASKVVGTWTSGTGDYAQQMTFAKDGTYTLASKAGKGVQRTESGTWKLEKDDLVLKCAKSSDAGRASKEKKLTVKSSTDDKLVLGDGPDKDDEITLTRAR